MDYQEKKKELDRIFADLTKEDVAVAFSGGADSSLILKLAVLHAEKNGTRVLAYTAQTELHPAEDRELAIRTAKEIGAEHYFVMVDELRDAGIENNPVDRCYRCKHLIFRSLQNLAKEQGISVVIEGTNLDDTKVYRPGLKALAELGIHSPLKEAEFTKAEVRALAAEYGISTASRPAAPCMATRFPYGTQLTREKLENVEKGEIFLKGLGFQGLRLRVHDNLARIEVLPEQMGSIMEQREQIVAGLKDLGYDYVTLDLQGFRSGSMDEVLQIAVK